MRVYRVTLGIIIVITAVIVLVALPGVLADSPPAKKSYVGSEQCGACHAAYFKTWKKTAHSMYIHGTKKKDLMGMPVDGKIKTIDSPATVKFRLARQGPKVKLTLYDLNDQNISTTYDIWRTQGGNGVAGEVRLLIRQDETTMISPVQWNHLDPTRSGDDKFSAYHSDHWYNTGGTLIHTGVGTAPAFAQSQFINSWERRCLGCHTTGTQLKYIAATGKFVDESNELNIGCEACHGPGSEHASSPYAENIINPASLDKQIGLDTCARCHIRGSGVDKGNAAFTLSWPSWVKKKKVRLYWQAGGKNELADMYVGGEVVWDSNDSKWRKSATHTNFSTEHHQQGYDYIQSGKWGEQPWQSVKCWECHDPHNSGVKDTAQLLMSVDDNELCLSCHAAHGFADDTEILAHTGHLSVNSVHCVDCHMPKTTKSQAWWTESGGDIHAHTFEVVDPNLTKLMAKKNKGTVADGKAITNGCYKCHRDSDYGAARWGRWK